MAHEWVSMILLSMAISEAKGWWNVIAFTSTQSGFSGDLAG